MWFMCVKNWAKFCLEHPKEQGLHGRTRHSLEYNIKMELQEVGWQGVMDWIHSA